MAKISELKEIIIELEMDLIKANIPQGHCPYAYFTINNKNKKDIDCNAYDWDCDKCNNDFYVEYEKEIRKRVKKL